MHGAEARLADGVEGFGELELEDDVGGSTMEASLHQFRGIEKVFGDASTGQKAGLVDVDDLANLVLEAERQGFAHGFH
jgi:hypothetical protein